VDVLVSGSALQEFALLVEGEGLASEAGGRSMPPL